jgi:hypothetical protein
MGRWDGGACSRHQAMQNNRRQPAAALMHPHHHPNPKSPPHRCKGVLGEVVRLQHQPRVLHQPRRVVHPHHVGPPDLKGHDAAPLLLPREEGVLAAQQVLHVVLYGAQVAALLERVGVVGGEGRREGAEAGCHQLPVKVPAVQSSTTAANGTPRSWHHWGAAATAWRHNTARQPGPPSAPCPQCA